ERSSFTESQQLLEAGNDKLRERLRAFKANSDAFQKQIQELTATNASLNAALAEAQSAAAAAAAPAPAAAAARPAKVNLYHFDCLPVVVFDTLYAVLLRPGCAWYWSASSSEEAACSSSSPDQTGADSRPNRCPSTSSCTGASPCSPCPCPCCGCSAY